MQTKICAILTAILSFLAFPLNAADVLTPGFLKVSLYTNIPGTAVSALTADPRYPAAPSEVRFLRSFNTRDALPNDALENFGGRISKDSSLRSSRATIIFFSAVMTRRSYGSAPTIQKPPRSSSRRKPIAAIYLASRARTRPRPLCR